MQQQLGKHKFYCEMCRKQCRDDNAFQQHKRSSFHQQNMIQFNEDPEFFISRFSKEVKDKFLEVFRVKYGFIGFIPINKAYNEYIKDPYHTHLNSTRWANLSEFATSLQTDGLVEMIKEPDMNGVEQVMIRLIDADKDKQDKLKAVMTKEDVREAERKREIKDIEKTIKLANKMMAAATVPQRQGLDEEIKEQFNGQLTFTKPSVTPKPSIFGQKPNIFGGVQSDDMLSGLIGKQKKSNLDKLLERSSAPQQQQRQKVDENSWVRVKMIVKIKHEGDKYHKQKGEVVQIKATDRIVVRFPDNKEIEFTEKQLSKVLPSENGHVWIISKKQLATITAIDLKSGTVTCKSSDGTVKVDINDICKINQ